MTPTEVITLIRGRLGARPLTAQLQSYLIQELNSAQAELEDGPFTPWFLERFTTFSPDVTAPSSGSSQYYMRIGQITDFIREVEDRPVIWQPSVSSTTVVHLDKKFEDELALKYNYADTTPRYYCESVGSDGYQEFKLFPYLTYNSSAAVGDYGYVSLNYYAKQGTLNSDLLTFTAVGSSGNASNKWYTFAPLVLAFKAGAVLAANYLKDQELAQALASEFQSAFAALKTKSIAREMAKLELDEPLLKFGSSSS